MIGQQLLRTSVYEANLGKLTYVSSINPRVTVQILTKILGPLNL